MVKVKQEAKKVNEKAYTTLVSPVVTEKSTMGAENGQVTFRVLLSATKPEIKAAIESLYKVKVTAVNTLIRKGKQRRFKGILSRQSDTKKAIITLAQGQAIDFTQAL